MTDGQTYVQQVTEAAEYIRSRIGAVPEFSITLGSGLGDLADRIEAEAVIPYAEIPYFPIPGAQGHKGELIYGRIAGVPIVGLSGRTHFYEVAHEPQGMRRVVFATHAMATLGVRTYFSTNAVGGLRPEFRAGDMMVVADHIGIFMPNPLLGEHLDFGGNWYFQPQNGAYAHNLRLMFRSAAVRVGESAAVHEGVYAALSGRTYETAAEVRALRALGADAVGMSTIPEVIVATNRGMRTIAVSIVSNATTEDGTNATSHEEVLAALNDPKTRDRLAYVFTKFFELYAESEEKTRQA